MQKNNDDLSEGKISIGKDRVRVDYATPSKILIILSEKKAMYYNHDLDEDEFFDPKNTSAWFFFEIFNNLNFLLDSSVRKENKNIILKKTGMLDDEEYVLKIYLEDNPIILRKITLNLKNDTIDLSLFNHNYNENFTSKYFKLINPNFFN